MTKSPTTMLALFLLAVAAPSGCSAQDGDVLDGFRVEAVDREANTPYELADRAYERVPESSEGTQEVELAFTRQGDNLWTLDYTLTGLLDASVAAQQVRIEIIQGEQAAWRAVRRGERWRCRRGDSASWTVELCP